MKPSPMHASSAPQPARRRQRGIGPCVASLVCVCSAMSAPLHAETIFRHGFDPLEPAPTVTILRDDRVATLEIDYDGENAWGQWWTMDGSGADAAGFRVSWWPDDAATTDHERRVPAIAGGGDGDNGCLAAHAQPRSPAGDARWLVTANRRVQLQPLVNDAPYVVRIERIDALGRVISQPQVLSFEGGDGARVEALRASLTHFDDFNLPLGAADETLWNNATVTSTDARFNLFFINDQYHAHTLQGTRVDNTGDRSQTSQRFRKALRIEPGQRRRIVFDMDSPLSPRSVWYLDLNPVRTDLTGHADFFDTEGATGLPAGMLRLRAQFQTFSVSLVGMDGASHRIAEVDMEAAGRQAVSNVRRAFEVHVGTDGIDVSIDGREVIDATFAPHALPAGDYEPLWIGFGYNTPKDGVPYYLLHWDNFGFDGPMVEPRTVHNYVTRIAGTDYRKANRGNGEIPSFTIAVPDDLRPVTPGATAEAWLVFTYQMGDYSNFALADGDHVEVNGGATFPLPERVNNSVPENPDLLAWGLPYTVRLELGELVQGGVSPLVVGDNTFRFFAENTGLLNVHVEVFYPPGSEPAWTPPAAIHPFPLHADLPRLGLPARFARIGGTEVGEAHLLTADPRERIAVGDETALEFTVGNRSYANWAPELMVFPVQSTEVWSSGGTTGIARVEVFLRAAGDAPPGQRVLALDTSLDAPAPQGRYVRTIDLSGFAEGDYDLFVKAISPSGLESHPSYGDETHVWDAADLAGAYYPIGITLERPARLP